MHSKKVTSKNSAWMSRFRQLKRKVCTDCGRFKEPHVVGDRCVFCEVKYSFWNPNNGYR